MTSRLLRGALHRSLDQVRHVQPVRPRQAHGLVATVYAEVERDFGMLAPPVALHSPAPGPLAASWLLLRETLIAPGPEGRAAREVVASAVSLGNACPYCVAVHGAALHSLDGSGTASAIAGDRLETIGDAATRELALWASGRSSPPDVPVERLAELVGVAATFHYLNRMVNVFLDDTPLPPNVPGVARDPLMRLLGRIMNPGRAVAERPAGPDLLPSAVLPDELAWAAPNPRIADAVARANAAIEDAGTRTVPPAVRDLVLADLPAWDGHTTHLSRAWLDEPLSALTPADRPAARLALLTARASHQITPADIQSFRNEPTLAGLPPGDAELIDLTSWASLTAARVLSSRLTGQPTTPRTTPTSRLLADPKPDRSSIR